MTCVVTFNWEKTRQLDFHNLLNSKYKCNILCNDIIHIKTIPLDIQTSKYYKRNYEGWTKARESSKCVHCNEKCTPGKLCTSPILCHQYIVRGVFTYYMSEIGKLFFLDIYIMTAINTYNKLLTICEPFR